MNKKWNLIFVLAGVFLLLSACFIKLFYTYQEYQAGQKAQQLLSKIKEENQEFKDVDEVSGSQLERESMLEFPKGVIGILTIPDLKLELPVLDETTDELLETSVCRYQGEAKEPFSKLVIAGHNYKRHFTDIKKLQPGDMLSLTGSSGVEAGFEVVELKEIAEDDFETLNGGEWDITLFTCNYNGNHRMLVRCRRVDNALNEKNKK